MQLAGRCAAESFGNISAIHSACVLQKHRIANQSRQRALDQPRRRGAAKCQPLITLPISPQLHPQNLATTLPRVAAAGIPMS